MNKLIQQYRKHKTAVSYYENTALAQADLIIKNAEVGFKNGEISFIQYQQSLTTALSIKTNYLDAVYQLNQSTIAIENLTGIK